MSGTAHLWDAMRRAAATPGITTMASTFSGNDNPREATNWTVAGGRASTGFGTAMRGGLGGGEVGGGGGDAAGGIGAMAMRRAGGGAGGGGLGGLTP